MANNVNPRRNNIQYTRRKPKNRKNNDAPLRILMLILAAAVCCSVVFLVNYLKEDEPVNELPKETDFQQTTGEKDDTQKQTEDEQTTEKPVETTPPEPIYVPEFKADLSEYEMYMNPQGEQRDAYLVLVNIDNPLGSDYVPPDLVNVKSTRKDGRATQKLREYAAKALEALMLEAEACGVIKKNTPSGYPLSVMSAYRSYDYQRYLFYDVYLVQEMNRGLSREAAEKKVATYSNRPGTSEHQSGLCVDMHTLPSAGQAFKNEAEAKWLAENCYKFGFILRYPEDKIEQTKGIMYEPWHFRYVGRYHAKKMYDMNMCLEEYTEYLKNNG
ncbi:MAG: M15 family metallopeptidase [Clostridia bacterium]|nr:M15 family metallopeptidase [Clostridia bacterium]